MWSSQSLQKVKRADNLKTFTIVGFGLTGLSLFCQLVEKLISNADMNNSSYKIRIFEKDKSFFATGLPYQTNCPSIWTLNNSASKLKLMRDGIDMATWMKENKNKWQQEFKDINVDYVPRALVGLYLKDKYEVYKKKAIASGIVVEALNCAEIVDIIKNNDTWKIMAKNSESYYTDYLFLCLGHVPSNHYPHLQNKPNYFHSDNGVEQFINIPKNASVHIIGGQAMFVDIALWLAYVNQHTGNIYTITRNSPIITTKGNTDECNKLSVEELSNTLKKLPNLLSFSDGKLLFWNAYKESTKYPVNIENPPTTRAALEYQIAKFKHLPHDNEKIGNIDHLRSFIFTFYFSGCYQEFWDKLQETGKEEFNRQLYSHLFAYLTGITPLNAELLLTLYQRDQIHEQSGLTQITYDDENKKFIISFKDGKKHEADYLIDSSGLGYDITKCNFPLLKNLIERGYLVPKKWGGILLNDCNQVVNRENQVQSNLFCIGPIASYGKAFPTPYASFIAIEEVEKSLNAVNTILSVNYQNHENSIAFC